MYKQTTVKTEGEPVVISREGPTSLTGVAVVIAMIMLIIGALLIMNGNGTQSVQQAVTNQQQANTQQQQFDTQRQQSNTSLEQSATSAQQSATRAQQSAPAQGAPGANSPYGSPPSTP